MTGAVSSLLSAPPVLADARLFVLPGAWLFVAGAWLFALPRVWLFLVRVWLFVLALVSPFVLTNA